MPTGGVLSPTLWNLVIGTLLKKLNTLAYTQAYADDVVIIIRGKDPSTIYGMANSCLVQAQGWADETCLESGACKSAAMMFTRRRRWKQQRLTLNGEEIETPDKIKYLGIRVPRLIST